MRLWYQLVSQHSGMNDFITRLQEHCSRAASPGTVVEVHGTVHGAEGDQYRLFFNYDVREVMDNALRIRREGGYDAFVLGNSLDPALIELREIMDIPVVSMMEVTCFTACMMGEKFGLVVPNKKFVPRYREIAVGYGLRDRLAAVEPINFNNILGFNTAFADRKVGDSAVQDILAASRAAIAQGAEVIVSVGPTSVLLADRSIYEIDGVPLLDCHSLLVKASEMMVAMKRLTGVHVSRKALYQAPPDELIQRVAKVREIRDLAAAAR